MPPQRSRHLSLVRSTVASVPSSWPGGPVSSRRFVLGTPPPPRQPLELVGNTQLSCAQRGLRASPGAVHSSGPGARQVRRDVVVVVGSGPGGANKTRTGRPGGR